MNGVVTIRGRGNRAVALPATVPLPAIVHAQHGGEGSFVVTGITSRAQRNAVLVSSLGSYSGTFPVGFVDPANDPTVALRVSTRGPWRLDIGAASLAHELTQGLSGVGDAVIVYRGPPTTAHLTYRSRSTLVINVYESGGVIPLVNTTGPYDGPISLVGGPAFIAVTTGEKWSMKTG